MSNSILSGFKKLFRKSTPEQIEPQSIARSKNHMSYRLPRTKPFVEKNFSGIYSCIGWNGGKLAYLLQTSVLFPYRNDDRSHAWTQSRDRSKKVKLPQPMNLGCRREYIRKNSLNYNSENCIDKLKVFEKFDALGIPHPRLIDPKTFQGKFLGRKNGGSRGRGITIYKPGDKIKEHDFFVELLECKSEHRIHFFKGQVVCELNKKIKDGSIVHTAEQGSPLEIGPITHPKKDEMIRYGLLGIQAMELDFGAVDIFVDVNDKVYILEVNSDPGMAGLIGFLYAERLRDYFNLPRPLNTMITANGELIDINLNQWLIEPPKPEELAPVAKKFSKSLNNEEEKPKEKEKNPTGMVMVKAKEEERPTKIIK